MHQVQPPLQKRGRVAPRPRRHPHRIEEEYTVEESSRIEIGDGGSSPDALDRALTRWKRVIDSVPCAVVWVDSKGRIAAVNRGARLLFECDPSALVDSSLFDHLESPLLRDLLRHAGRMATRSTCAGKARTGKGRVTPVELVIDGHGDDQPLSLIITTAEGTDRQRLQRDVLDMRERERRRIGRDLHDSLGQQMVGLGMLVRDMARRLSEQDNDLAEIADRTVEIIDEMVLHTRDLARGLYPVELEAKGLVQALRALVTQTSDRAGVRAELRVYEGRPITLDVERAAQIFRITQEALSNALRHAKAHSILVSVQNDDEGLDLSVIDDGSGMPDRNAQGDGMGLRMMAERASILGGVLTVGSEEGRGTRVRCIIPSAASTG